MTFRPPVKPGDSLVLLRMDCRPETPVPEHRGGTGGELISFTFGVAMVSKSASEAAGRTYPDALVYFRIQDHMRRMGLARRAMRELVHGGKVTVNRVCWPENGPHKFEIERIFNSVKKEQPDLRNMRV